MIGAVVGVQPFGGMGLSGTGPKAGGPNYLRRFVCEQTVTTNTTSIGGNASLLVNDLPSNPFWDGSSNLANKQIGFTETSRMDRWDDDNSSLASQNLWLAGLSGTKTPQSSLIKLMKIYYLSTCIPVWNIYQFSLLLNQTFPESWCSSLCCYDGELTARKSHSWSVLIGGFES